MKHGNSGLCMELLKCKNLFLNSIKILLTNKNTPTKRRTEIVGIQKFTEVNKIKQYDHQSGGCRKMN